MTWADHLTSVLLAGVVTLILASVWAIGRSGQVATTLTYHNRAHVSVIRTIIDGDMASLGAGVPDAEPAILGLTWTGTSRTFEFRASTGAASGAGRIRYSAVPVPCSAGGTGCWQFRREVHTGTAYVPRGFNVETNAVSIALGPTGPASDATEASVHFALAGSAEHGGLPLTMDRRYRLVNQVLRAANG